MIVIDILLYQCHTFIIYLKLRAISARATGPCNTFILHICLKAWVANEGVLFYLFSPCFIICFHTILFFFFSGMQCIQLRQECIN